MKISRPASLSAGLVLCAATLVLSAGAGAGTVTGITLAAQDAAAATGAPALNPSHPDQYVVKRGDTLWGIAAMFLRDPWYWPEIWYANPQVANPHLIYPGDVLELVYVNGRPRLQHAAAAAATSGGSGKLSPRIREQSLEEAIPTIPLEVIGPFLSRGAILEKGDVKRSPYVVAIRDDHIAGAAGNEFYVRGDVGAVDQGYSVVHVGDKLIDPDDGDVVGYEGIYVGEGSIRRTGDPATLFMSDSAREAREGDRLIRQDVAYPAQIAPHAPSRPVEGSIIHVVDGVSQIGQYQVVVINRGKRDGLELGHVLRVWQRGGKVTDHSKPGRVSQKVRLPDEPAGISMVFRTYDRVSFALIMQATSEIHVLDVVRNPN
ncbi:MAG: LysM peptidoglycan-binding domain-containing protein [Gammaproteobacteria bacterium]|nr:LysM peptidoglycan-binding domain-containing protein [Gammaproteobacteria bacterium]